MLSDDKIARLVASANRHDGSAWEFADLILAYVPYDRTGKSGLITENLTQIASETGYAVSTIRAYRSVSYAHPANQRGSNRFYDYLESKDSKRRNVTGKQSKYTVAYYELMGLVSSVENGDLGSSKATRAIMAAWESVLS